MVPEAVRLGIRVADGPLPVRIDPSLLRQVVVDLALNGVDAMPEGARRELEVGRKRPGRVDPGTPGGAPGAPDRALEAVVVVRDTGQGIPPEHRERIFGPFFSTKRDDRATGLGLSTVYGVVRQAGGEVEVAGEPDEDSNFTVRVPLVRDGTADHATDEEDA